MKKTNLLSRRVFSAMVCLSIALSTSFVSAQKQSTDSQPFRVTEKKIIQSEIKSETSRKNQNPIISNVSGVPTKTIRPSSKFTVTLNGSQLNELNSVELRQNNKTIAKGVLERARGLTDHRRRVTFTIPDTFGNGSLVLSAKYKGKDIQLPSTGSIRVVSTTYSGSVVSSARGMPTTGTTTPGAQPPTSTPIWVPKTIQVGSLVGTGAKFDAKIIEVQALVGTGMKFEAKTINVQPLMGAGMKFEAKTINVQPLKGTGMNAK